MEKKKRQSLVPVFLIIMVVLLTGIQIYMEMFAPKPGINHLSWLVGTWQNEGGKTYEHWERKNDTLLEGYSFKIIGNDTVTSGKIKIVIRKGEIYYIPVQIKDGQENSLPYKLVTKEPQRLIFENLDVDFPKVITYKKKDYGKFSLKIEGDDKEFEFKYKRVK